MKYTILALCLSIFACDKASNNIQSNQTTTVPNIMEIIGAGNSNGDYITVWKNKLDNSICYTYFSSGYPSSVGGISCVKTKSN